MSNMARDLTLTPQERQNLSALLEIALKSGGFQVVYVVMGLKQKLDALDIPVPPAAEAASETPPV